MRKHVLQASIILIKCLGLQFNAMLSAGLYL